MEDAEEEDEAGIVHRDSDDDNVGGCCWPLWSYLRDLLGTNIGGPGALSKVSRGTIGALGAILGRKGRSINSCSPSWVPLCALVGRLGGFLGPSWGPFGPSWDPVGGPLWPSWSDT